MHKFRQIYLDSTNLYVISLMNRSIFLLKPAEGMNLCHHHFLSPHYSVTFLYINRVRVHVVVAQFSCVMKVLLQSVDFWCVCCVGSGVFSLQMANVEVICCINFICARREMRCVCLHGVTGVSLRFTYGACSICVGGGFTQSNFQDGGGGTQSILSCFYVNPSHRIILECILKHSDILYSKNISTHCTLNMSTIDITLLLILFTTPSTTLIILFFLCLKFHKTEKGFIRVLHMRLASQTVTEFWLNFPVCSISILISGYFKQKLKYNLHLKYSSSEWADAT